MTHDVTIEPLYLLHTQPDPQRLAAWAARHRLLDSQGDLGYALHALLHAAFGEHAPQPFRYLDAEQGLLAYTRLNAAELTQRAALADPDVSAALGLGQTLHHQGLSARKFPAQWAVGHVLGFDVRVRPIIREGKTGRERDAFLAAVEKAAGAELERSEVYVQWLRDLLARQGGAELVDARMTRYQQLGVTRKSQKGGADDVRHSRLVGGPDAVLTGQLRVTTSQAFAQLLVNGLGRHRAFGFGLLMLRPARG
ncbi:type I-E CRISPR-associated protein Cas6/Cse3/CasE [Rhodoferax sp.]|uniref:type I-E CRISPR-associated protein Cas6/Cse3/CasE n=1 Tax=Rhodoferax sp. TaxID=50421 RepID=UPI0019DEEC2D|nr:type I-E CRISPR-associated protein Cas6/Cse3/CasE [Rhodoferax sp.]MBE0474411.1 type I-E CRISPR-associated protein Cas6/Cse3/CasE [Rhodoferax sp.]